MKSTVSRGLLLAGVSLLLYTPTWADPQLDKLRNDLAEGRLIACGSNLTNIDIAIEMFETDFQKQPKTLSELVPGYLKSMPRCPAADKEGGVYRYTPGSTTFRLWCSGNHHVEAGAPKDYPRVTYTEGLLYAPGRKRESTVIRTRYEMDQMYKGK